MLIYIVISRSAWSAYTRLDFLIDLEYAQLWFIVFVESEFSNNVNMFVRCNIISFYSILHNRKSFPPRTPREGTLDAMSLHYAETSLPDLLSSLSLHYSEQTSAMQTVPPLCSERAPTIYGTAFFKILVFMCNEKCWEVLRKCWEDEKYLSIIINSS